MKSPTEPDLPKVMDGIPGGPGQPTVQLTSVPDYGTYDNLKGVVLHVRPDEYRVAVFIRVDGAWWTKPYFASPTITIEKNGTWVCDITTGGADHLATDIAAFLIPSTFVPALASGLRDIPASVQQNAVAQITVARTPKLRTLTFSGYQWQIKTGAGVQLGPGPNYFSDDTNNVFVDGSGRLHLKIAKLGSNWQCAEVILNRSLGYGRYVFNLEGGFERINQNAVLGLFTWDTGAPEVNYREIDIEFSRWSVAGNQNAQFVVQPFTRPGNISRFEFPSFPASLHSFGWSRQGVDFESGSGGAASSRWTYTGSSVPTAGNENVRINLWLYNGAAPSDGRDIEVIIRSFQFTP